MSVTLLMGRIPRIVAAGRNDYVVSLLDDRGIEHLIGVYPETPFGDAFGDLSGARACQDLVSPDPDQIAGVSIRPDLGLLTIRTHQNIDLVWRIAS